MAYRPVVYTVARKQWLQRRKRRTTYLRLQQFSKAIAVAAIIGITILAISLPQAASQSIDVPQTLPAIEPTSTPVLSLPELSDHYAAQYKVNPKVMRAIIACESSWNPTIQSNHHYQADHPAWGVKAGDRELSFGLVQIHLPAHPDITKEQALDPAFALEYLAKKIAAGEAAKWTCYRLNF